MPIEFGSRDDVLVDVGQVIPTWAHLVGTNNDDELFRNIVPQDNNAERLECKYVIPIPPALVKFLWTYRNEIPQALQLLSFQLSRAWTMSFRMQVTFMDQCQYVIGFLWAAANGLIPSLNYCHVERPFIIQ